MREVYESRAIYLARYIIHKANKEHYLITNLKLQKILYYVQGMYLARFGERLFDDEIEAWTYGPVVRSVYNVYCLYGAVSLYEPEDISLSGLTLEKQKFIDMVIMEKLKYSGSELVRMTHQEAPWKSCEDRISDKPVIPFETIQRFFKEKDASCARMN